MTQVTEVSCPKSRVVSPANNVKLFRELERLYGETGRRSSRVTHDGAEYVIFHWPVKFSRIGHNHAWRRLN